MSKYRIIHMCVNIRGALRNMENMRTKTKSFMIDDKGNGLNVGEARNLLYNELSKGRKVLPLGKECEGFDYQDGCPGHK